MRDKKDTLPIDIIARIITLYERHSRLFQEDEAKRRRYFGRHPTFFACLKCMDGRVEFPAMTKTARGLVKPYRAVGGKFELFWPAFQRSLALWVRQAVMHDAHSCVFVSSHFCSADKQLGCKGWDNDTAAARRHMERLAGHIAEDFGEQVVAIPTTVDTAIDNLVLHGPNGDVSGVALASLNIETVCTELRKAFPAMPEQVIGDIAPFLLGNAEHVRELKQNPRSKQELEHDERVIALGEGFEGLASHNFALMNSDVNPNLDAAAVMAAKLIEQQMAAKPSIHEAAIFTNIFYGGKRGVLSGLPATEKRCAVRRSRGLQEFAQKHIRERCPALCNSGRLRFLTAVTREPTRELEIIEQGRIT